MVSTVDDRTVRLSDVVVRLRRRIVVVVVTTVLAGGLGAAVGLNWPATYSATAVVTVSPITTTPFSSTPINQQINITTERAVVLSSEVAALAAEAGAPLPPEEIPGALSIDSPLNSQVLEITATYSDAAGAAETANDVADAYLDFRAQGAQGVADKIVVSLTQRIDDLREQLSDDPEEALLPSQVALQQQITDLRLEQSALQGISLNPGRVVTTATAPDSPSGPGPLLFVAPALVLGLLLGIALALLRDATDPKVRTGGRLQELVTVPVVHEDRSGDAAELARRVVLRLGLVSPDVRRPVLLGVMAGDEAVGSRLSELLLEAFVASGQHALSVPKEAITAQHADRGWPDEAQLKHWAMADIVLVGLSTGASRVRLAMLAQRMDVVVVAVAPSSRRRDVATLLADAADAGVRPAAAVLVPSHRHSGHTADPADTGTADEPASRSLAAALAPMSARAELTSGPTSQARPAGPSERDGSSHPDADEGATRPTGPEDDLQRAGASADPGDGR